MKLKQLLRKIANNNSPSPQGGYTILEGLVAMVIVAVLMSAVAPVIVLSVGTRVQARRIELGAQAARSYIDTVRSGVKDGPWPASVPLSTVDAPDPNAPTFPCPADDYCTSSPERQFYCVDGDGTGKCEETSLTDMIVQGASRGGSGFQTTSTDAVTGDTTVTGANYPMGYRMLVRVYRADAFQETSLCPEGADCPAAGTQQSAVTNAIGNRRLPVTETITDIGPTERSFNNLRDRLE